uniref:BZIP domain-containing protein n=1 Tax=Macrostomum lignano TaxID=282301 RepID=A0A1I8H250_9PLAT
MDSIFPFHDCLLDLDGVDFDVDELMPPDRPVFDDGDDDDADEDSVMSSSLTSSVDETPPPRMLPRRGRGRGGGVGRKSKSSNMRTKGEANREAAYRAKQRQSNSLAKSQHSQLVADNQRLEAEVASAESQLQFLLHLCRRRPAPSKRRLQLRVLEADEDCDPPQLGSKPKVIT